MCPRTTPGAEEATEAPTGVGDPATEVAWEGLTPRETTDIVPRPHVATVATGPTEQGGMQGCGPRVPSLW